MPGATSRRISPTESPLSLGNRCGSARECIWRCRRACSRSRLSCNYGITLANAPGIIDPGYRGEIRCKLVNLSDEAYTVYPLERIAQLVFLPFVNAVFTEVDSLPESSRGEDGYGSTGAM